MSTAIDYRPSQPNIRSRNHYTQLHLQNTNHSIELTDFTTSPPPPAYTEQAQSNSSSTHPPPFLTLQIETPGKPIISLPLPPHPDPIPIYLLDPSSQEPTTTPKFISLRPSRTSGSSYLVPANSPSTILSTTTYRFGPGKPPRVRLFHPCSPSSTEEDDTSSSSFEILSTGLFTRAVRFQPPGLLPTSTPTSSASSHTDNEKSFFTWRYATKKERKSLSNTISSLLILEIKKPIHNGEAATIPIARFIRSAEFRTKGSSVSSAGNGGRLEILDLDKAGWGEKVDRETALVMVVTTGLVMLKREVDRRRAGQIAVLAGGASGG